MMSFMPGKNQQKRLEKRRDNALRVWEKDQLTAANAHKIMEEALVSLEKYKDELTAEQLAWVEARADEQSREIERFLMTAREKFLKKSEELGVDLTFN
jgi:hypothetical protein